MKHLIKFQTFDGALHDTAKAAKQHVEAKYADMLSKLTHRLLSEGNCKYAATGDFIDANLNVFLELSRIKSDVELVQEEDDSHD